MTTSTHGEPPHGGRLDACGPVTGDELRVAWRIQEARVNAEERKLRDTPLPEYFSDAECCANPSIQVVTTGYIQWCRVDETALEKGVIHAYTDGWGDMSEDGSLCYVECAMCHKVWAVPDEIEWN